MVDERRELQRLKIVREFHGDETAGCLAFFPSDLASQRPNALFKPPAPLVFPAWFTDLPTPASDLLVVCPEAQKKTDPLQVGKPESNTSLQSESALCTDLSFLFLRGLTPLSSPWVSARGSRKGDHLLVSRGVHLPSPRKALGEKARSGALSLRRKGNLCPADPQNERASLEFCNLFSGRSLVAYV